MHTVILILDDDEREQRDRMLFECAQSPDALEQALGELLVLRKLKAAVKAVHQPPKVLRILDRFPVKSIVATAKCEPERVQPIEPIDTERKLWYVD